MNPSVTSEIVQAYQTAAATKESGHDPMISCEPIAWLRATFWQNALQIKAIKPATFDLTTARQARDELKSWRKALVNEREAFARVRGTARGEVDEALKAILVGDMALEDCSVELHPWYENAMIHSVDISIASLEQTISLDGGKRPKTKIKDAIVDELAQDYLLLTGKKRAAYTTDAVLDVRTGDFVAMVEAVFSALGISANPGEAVVAHRKRQKADKSEV